VPAWSRSRRPESTTAAIDKHCRSVILPACMRWLMARAAMSQPVFDHLYDQDSWFRTKLHLKPKNPRIYRRNLRIGFGFPTPWGVAAVYIGVAILISERYWVDVGHDAVATSPELFLPGLARRARSWPGRTGTSAHNGSSTGPSRQLFATVKLRLTEGAAL
jgi:hypothetical protein